MKGLVRLLRARRIYPNRIQAQIGVPAAVVRPQVGSLEALSALAAFRRGQQLIETAIQRIIGIEVGRAPL